MLGVRYTTLQYGAEPAAGSLSSGRVWTVNDDSRQARIRRVEHGLTALHLVVKKACEVMVLGKSNTVVLGTIGLNKHLPARLASASPASDLGEELEQALRSTKIRNGQGGIGRHHADQGDIGVIVSFGNHLCAHQDIDGTTAQSTQNALMGRFGPGGVAIHTRQARRGKQCP